MKNLLAAAIIVTAVMAALSACSGCSTESRDGSSDSVPEFGKADTAEVLALTGTYLDHVRDGEYDAAVAMLRVIENDSVMTLPETTERNVRMQQKAFPVLAYHLTGMDFVNRHRVRVTYDIEFFKKDSADRIQNTISLTFAPQRIGNSWYLELLDR